jgi:hypothetical protein
MKTPIVAALLGATLFTGVAAAQDAPPPRRDPLAAADANQDGVITKEEMLAQTAARFAKLDANGDGKVTAAERENARGGGTGGRGMDGDMTLADMQAQAARRFDRLDTNGDGKIDQAERAAMRERMMGMPGDRQGPPPPPAPDGQ